MAVLLLCLAAATLMQKLTSPPCEAEPLSYPDVTQSALVLFNSPDIRAADWLKAMIFAGLALRLLVCVLVLPEHLNPARDHWSFGWEMGRVAHSIYTGHGFSSPLDDASGPTAFYAPIYPYLIAGCMKLFGGYTAASALAMLFLNSVFSAATAVPVFFLALRLLGKRAALVSGWVWAFFPYAIELSAERIWENTLSCLVASCLWLQTVRLLETGSKKNWLIWGGLWGLAGLINPALLAPLPFLGAWLVLRSRYILWRGLLQAMLVFLAFVTPWTVRNYRIFHKLIPLRDNFWLEVHVGNNGDTSDVTPDSALLSHSVREYSQFRQLGELAYMEAKKAQCFSNLRDHPGLFVRMTFRHICYFWTGFWSLQPGFVEKEPFQLANVMFSGSMLLLMLLGLRFTWLEGSRDAVFFFGTVLITFPVVYYITHPSIDYRHPIDPLIVILDCYGVLNLLAFRKTKSLLVQSSA